MRYRVCKFIYKYVLEYGHRLENNRYVFYGKLSHYDISKYIGINRVSVSTVMRNLEVEGLINKTNDKLEILMLDCRGHVRSAVPVLIIPHLILR